MDVHVVVPWRGGCPHREAALDFVLAAYAGTWPGWRVHVAEAPPGPWRKAAALGPVIDRLPDAAVVVVADGDVWCDVLDVAVACVGSGGAPWCVPHGPVWRLSREATAGVLAGGAWPADGVAESTRAGVVGGGLLVLPAGTWRRVPMDCRFSGWGQEDESWGWALRTLAGRGCRGAAPLWHLWHPPARRATRAHGNPDGMALRARYRAARGHPGVMAALVDAGRLP